MITPEWSASFQKIQGLVSCWEVFYLGEIVIINGYRLISNNLKKSTRKRLEKIKNLV